MSLSVLSRPRAVLAAILAVTALSACGNVTGPSDGATKRPSLTPKTVAHDDTPTDTTAKRPTIPWY